MKILIKRLNDLAKVPHKANNEDFCYDVYATSCEEIAPNVFKYGIGLAFQIVRPENDKETSLAIDVRPRSSIWKTGMILSNSIGTVDEGYRGEVSLVFNRVNPGMEIYKVGDRIGQIKLGITTTMEFEWSEELSETERGSGGYGSTGR